MENTFFLQWFWTNFIPISSSTGPKQSSVTCHFFWLFYFWTGTPGRWPGMFLVIVWTLAIHNLNDFAPLSRNQNHIFRCHTVTNSTDLRRSPQWGGVSSDQTVMCCWPGTKPYNNDDIYPRRGPDFLIICHFTQVKIEYYTWQLTAQSSKMKIGKTMFSSPRPSHILVSVRVRLGIIPWNSQL